MGSISEFINFHNIKLINLDLNISVFTKNWLFSKPSVLHFDIYLIFPLLKLLNKNKPDYIINHLITSLP